MRARGVCLYSLLSVTCLAQQDPSQLLRQIRHKVADSIGNLPRYLCTETVDRKSLEPGLQARGRKAGSCAEILAAAEKPNAKMQLFSSDRLRLDVAIARDGEMYSWVGGGQFEDKSLGDLVKQGATSTGAFGSYLQSIFVAEAANFGFKGEGEWNGRHVLNYTFRVPLERSGYTVGNRAVSRLLGYSGSFAADAATLDLLRLELHTDDMPPELEMCAAETTLDYTQVRMNKVDFLLPAEANMRIVNTDASESRNRTVFTGCHQFMGESKLIFDDSSGATAPEADSKSKAITLPAGLKLSVALAESIDLATAAAGDPVTGRLTRAVKDSPSDLTIPKGTKLNGRIFELHSSYGAATSLEFGLKWEGIEMSGANHKVELLLKAAAPGTARLPLSHSKLQEVAAEFRPDDRGVGFFMLPEIGKDYRIPVGFEAEWVTLPALPPEK
jgi:hypothetical protein